MSPQEPTTTGTRPTHRWREDTVFGLFAEPVRGKLLLALARQPWQPPSKLKEVAERSLDGTMKRLASMRSNGFVVTKGDTVDTRRQLYALAPGVPLVSTEGGRVLDFGFLKVPLDTHEAQGKSAQPGTVPWKPNAIYPLFTDLSRRRMIARLARTPFQSADQLNQKADYKISAALKHLHVLHSSGLVVKSPNERDGRRSLYSLSPSAVIQQNENGMVLELGFCTVRF